MINSMRMYCSHSVVVIYEDVVPRSLTWGFVASNSICANFFTLFSKIRRVLMVANWNDIQVEALIDDTKVGDMKFTL